MKATICTTATLVLVFVGIAPAADPRLVHLVMPDATVIAGVNVAQAKVTPFGQYVLQLIAPHDKELQVLATLTGFDPRQDVIELLAATNSAAGSASAGLALARGAFNMTAITNAALVAGATSEVYQSVTILESPTKTEGVAFLDSTLAIIGDLASVKGAIDRQSSGQHLSSTVVSQINQLSGTNDAWVLTTVPPASLHPPTAAPSMPNGLNLQALQQIQQGTAAVKFGVNVTVTATAQMDTAQNATTLASLVQLLANMAQMQAQKAPEAAALAKSVTATAAGNTVNVSFSIPQAQIQQMVEQGQKPHKAAVKPELKKQ